ncbi:uncharacterized protein MELLADRAFT_78789 [Melampsora larici-populina 98AG31]|uniref:FACT complex subunit n=1 Tax=Melampsora larici-populina (strain 98AG31 / pathotype 3-4-7) TaxID=747676 RepID=F4RYV5_MELLP|nr:uncharacterized protein MELLADRAFT_78789 [Melampsora larici-populina 98AG31]EGG02438.1 hypothetical protein MELLADRAFT_78789 [Melampsora larici-populina 98AG31]
MSEVNPVVFHRRLGKLLDLWKNATEADAETLPLLTTGGILLVSGNTDEIPYPKSYELQKYLFGSIFSSTLIFITLENITFLCSEQKAERLRTLVSDSNIVGAAVTVSVLVRSKEPGQSTKLLKEVGLAMSKVAEDGMKLGCFTNDKHGGHFVDEWNTHLKQKKKRLKQIKKANDISLVISALMARKDSDEMQIMEIASKMAEKLMRLLFQQLTNSLEDQKEITPERLTDIIEAKLEDSDIWKGMDFGFNFDTAYASWIYTPIIQSQGVYDLRTLVQSTDERLNDARVILASLGIRYKRYCSNISRVILIDPHPTQESNYNYLMDLQRFALQELKEGVIVKEFYQTIFSKVSRERPDLESTLPESFGFGIGIIFKDPFLNLDTRCDRRLKSDMIFSLEMSFSNIQDPFDSSKTYSLQLIDMVAVKNETAIILSNGIIDSKDFTFLFKNKQQDDIEGLKNISQSSAQPDKPSGIPPTTSADTHPVEHPIKKSDLSPPKVLPDENLDPDTSIKDQPQPSDSKISKHERDSDDALEHLIEAKKLKAIAMLEANDQIIMSRKLEGLDEDSQKWYILKKRQILKKLEEEIVE